MKIRRFVAFALVGSALASFLVVGSTPSQTQAWPTRQPIRVIVPLTAGSAIDIVARIVFEQISNQIGQTVVIENRAGASQTIGAGAVAKAEPDGNLAAAECLALLPPPAFCGCRYWPRVSHVTAVFTRI